MRRVTEVQVEVGASSLEAVEGFLYLQGADSLALEDESTGPGEGRAPLARGQVRLLAYFETSPTSLEEGLKTLCQDALFSQREIDPDLYRDRWKEHFKPAKISPKLWVRPSWEALPRPLEDKEREIVLDPGAAFGTGLHETTRLCLRELDQLITPGASLLDFGTGSGILAIAGALLGARPVLALDNDPLAVLVARENAQRNAVSIKVDDLPLEQVQETFSVVVANILAATLVTLRGPLWARVAPSGALVLAGLLARELAQVQARFEEEGAPLLHQEILGEWGALCFRRPEEA